MAHQQGRGLSKGSSKPHGALSWHMVPRGPVSSGAVFRPAPGSPPDPAVRVCAQLRQL